jgi:hypothetical protein
MLSGSWRHEGGRIEPFTICPAEATEVAQWLGFNIEFRMYSLLNADFSARSMDSIVRFLHDNHYAVFIAPYDWPARLPDGLIQDITHEVVTHLPGLYRDLLDYGYDVDGTVYLLPTWMSSGWTVHPPVSVRTDVLEEYGKPIYDIGDYEELLIWLRERHGGAAGVTWSSLRPEFTTQQYHATTMQPLDLFMPRLGYASLRGMFLQDTGATNHLWMDREGNIAAWWEFDDAAFAFADYMDWHDRGLIDFVEPGGHTFVGDALQRLPEDGVADYLTILGSIGYNVVDHSAFTTIRFAEPALWIPNVRTVAFSLSGADITEFLLFYQYLLSDPDAYAAFRYGIEGEDWEWVEIDDEFHLLKFADFSLRSYIFRITREFIGTNRHNHYLFPHHPPSESVRPPEFPLPRAQRRDIGRALQNHAEHQAFLAQLNRYLNEYMINMHSDPGSVYDFGQFMRTIREMPGSDIATRMVNDALMR